MCSFLFLIPFLLIHEGFACFGSAPRSFVAPSYQYNQQPYFAPAARVAGAPNVESVLPIASDAKEGSFGGSAVSQRLFGSRVLLSEFSSNGYNSEGGGPVSQGENLKCNFENKPCCWANVPSPDDQIDWQTASGLPESSLLQNISIEGKYLVAYASLSAPSDEAQFSSCSIGCASSSIRVRAKHWQSSNVLLQVCQRESFPNTVNYNPLLNCQEYPFVPQATYTDVILPKASLVDIVFVASNFVSEKGDIAILDNIEVVYESDSNECGSFTSENNNFESIGLSSDSEKLSSNNFPFSSDNGLTELDKNNDNLHVNDVNFPNQKDLFSGFKNKNNFEKDVLQNFNDKDVSAKAFGVSGISHNTKIDSQKEILSMSSNLTKKKNNENFSDYSCQRIKCTFENETTCYYVETENGTSIRGFKTQFQAVKGQFMNRVTGVREGAEGNYYAATFLFPRERAELITDVGQLPGNRQLRFQYYEGTHGLQLKGCCDYTDTCPFSSDKFVSVSDRMWKFGEFVCPRGTQKIIFACENTRTNQGACALDDIQVFEDSKSFKKDDQPLC